MSTPQAQADLETQELLVDSFEQGRFRPLDNQEQTQYFSGKKANHTLKTQVISLPNGADIVDVLTAERGPEADINLIYTFQLLDSTTEYFYSKGKGLVGSWQFSGTRLSMGHPEVKSGYLPGVVVVRMSRDPRGVPKDRVDLK